MDKSITLGNLKISNLTLPFFVYKKYKDISVRVLKDRNNFWLRFAYLDFILVWPSP